MELSRTGQRRLFPGLAVQAALAIVLFARVSTCRLMRDNQPRTGSLSSDHFVHARLTRRQVLKAGFAASALTLLRSAVALGGLLPPAATRTGFLSSHERALVEAATARILPSGASAGAREIGVTDYIQGLLSAFPETDVNVDGRRNAADLSAVAQLAGTTEALADLDGNGIVDAEDAALAETALFAGRPLYTGGPVSDRNPLADASTGTASHQFSENFFLHAVRLSRLRRLAWKVRLDGIDAAPELAANPLATVLLDTDMRRKYRTGLQRLEQLALARRGRSFLDLNENEQDGILEELRRSDWAFLQLLTEHTIEAIFCVPEYGGNRHRLGWQLTGFDGDSQPLGYTIFDETAGMYRERPDKPNSVRDPNDRCEGFSAEMTEFLRAIVFAQQGTEFPQPFCFD